MGGGSQQIFEQLLGKAVLALLGPSQNLLFFSPAQERQGPCRPGKRGRGHAQADDPVKVQAPHLEPPQHLHPRLLHTGAGKDSLPSAVAQPGQNPSGREDVLPAGGGEFSEQGRKPFQMLLFRPLEVPREFQTLPGVLEPGRPLPSCGARIG